MRQYLQTGTKIYISFDLWGSHFIQLNLCLHLTQVLSVVLLPYSTHLSTVNTDKPDYFFSLPMYGFKSFSNIIWDVKNIRAMKLSYLEIMYVVQETGKCYISLQHLKSCVPSLDPWVYTVQHCKIGKIKQCLWHNI
jgi:hypothetical protein